MGDLFRATVGYDVLRGKVKKVINGDTFDLMITEVAAENIEQYDTVERIHVLSISTEEEDAEPVGDPDISAGEQVTPDDPSLLDVETGEEMEGTPEEAAQGSGTPNPTEYYNVRTKEDLEAQIRGREVDCIVRERDESGRLICDVTVL